MAHKMSTMKHHSILPALAVLLGILAGLATAHERFRFVGTVTEKTAKEMWITTTKDKKKIGMDLDEKTKFTRDKKPVPASAIKVGSTVVVDAWGDDETDLVALEVRLVPPVTAPPKAKGAGK